MVGGVGRRRECLGPHSMMRWQSAQRRSMHASSGPPAHCAGRLTPPFLACGCVDEARKEKCQVSDTQVRPEQSCRLAAANAGAQAGA